MTGLFVSGTRRTVSASWSATRLETTSRATCKSKLMTSAGHLTRRRCSPQWPMTAESRFGISNETRWPHSSTSGIPRQRVRGSTCRRQWSSSLRHPLSSSLAQQMGESACTDREALSTAQSPMRTKCTESCPLSPRRTSKRKRRKLPISSESAEPQKLYLVTQISSLEIKADFRSLQSQITSNSGCFR